MQTMALEVRIANAIFICMMCMFLVSDNGGLGHDMTGPFRWQTYDNFDRITEAMSSINAKNCKSKAYYELRLREDTLAQMPRFNKLLTSITYPNRTALLHLHNMALNRAFFFSYLFRKLEKPHMFNLEPGLMYHYFSNAASVTANEYNINGSALFFDADKTYMNWYSNLPFNTTVPLFGPRAFRAEDAFSPTNWKREPTNRTIDVIDYGGGNNRNYTTLYHKTNPWYRKYLPDERGSGFIRMKYDVGIKYSDTRGEFRLGDKWQAYSFQGPPSPGQGDENPLHLPVMFTEPYYDCGHSNKWIVSAVAPVVDKLPRYIEWAHLRRNFFTAVVTMDIDFMAIDINPCPISVGNEGPNYFAGTARCRNTTMCEPLSGWGFRRGGYQCVCRAGYRYPHWQKGPFQGIDIESATLEEYEYSFDCLDIRHRQAIPVIPGNRSVIENAATSTKPNNPPSVNVPQPATEVIEDQKEIDVTRINWATLDDKTRSKKRKRDVKYANRSPPLQHKDKRKVKYVPKNIRVFSDKENNITSAPKTERKRRFVSRFKRQKRKRREAIDNERLADFSNIMTKIANVDKDNCHLKDPNELTLPGDVAYGVEEQFSSQARVALRTAHFLSDFLQNIDTYEEYGNLKGDRMLNVEQLFGEVLANVMGDLKIKGSGIFFDEDAFVTETGRKELFAPYAFRHYPENEEGEENQNNDNNEFPDDVVTTSFRALDYAGYPEHYLDEPWFSQVKERWVANTYGLQTFGQRPRVRTDLNGTSVKKYVFFPIRYSVPKETDGWWSQPYFDCDGYVNEWILTYSAPFFGRNSIRSALMFKGVVIVDIKLSEIDISQCPMDFFVPNAFKGTALCHYESTYCVDLPGKGFQKGSYKCECRQGYEYPYADRAWYYDGQSVEKEYEEKMAGRYSRYDTLTCRIASASGLHADVTVMFVLLIITLGLLDLGVSKLS